MGCCESDKNAISELDVYFCTKVYSRLLQGVTLNTFCYIFDVYTSYKEMCADCCDLYFCMEYTCV